MSKFEREHAHKLDGSDGSAPISYNDLTDLPIAWPVGVVLPYAGTVAPDGFYMADGSAKSRTEDAALFAVCGTAFGAGDGSTTFNLPDPAGASLVGAGTSTGYTANETIALGTKYDDRFQGMKFKTNAQFKNTGGSTTAGWFLHNGGTAYEITTGNPVTDGTNGTPRTGPTTRGKALGINYIIKY